MTNPRPPLPRWENPNLPLETRVASLIVWWRKVLSACGDGLITIMANQLERALWAADEVQD